MRLALLTILLIVSIAAALLISRPIQGDLPLQSAVTSTEETSERQVVVLVTDSMGDPIAGSSVLASANGGPGKEVAVTDARGIATIPDFQLVMATSKSRLADPYERGQIWLTPEAGQIRGDAVRARISEILGTKLVLTIHAHGRVEFVVQLPPGKSPRSLGLVGGNAHIGPPASSRYAPPSQRQPLLPLKFDGRGRALSPPLRLGQRYRFCGLLLPKCKIDAYEILGPTRPGEITRVELHALER